LEEIYYLSRNFHFTREDIFRMPIFERRFYLNKLSEEIETKNDAWQQSKNKRGR
jgi:hypothetical protein